MTRTLIAILSAFASATGDIVRLWPGVSPGEVPGEFGPEVTIDQRVYNVSVPTYETYLNKSGHGGGIVIAPGGGYKHLAIVKEGSDVAAWLNGLGFHAFVLKYRVPPRPPAEGMPVHWAPLEDAQRAMGMIRDSAAEYGLNSSRLGFMGFSAGSHLTAYISTNWQHRIYKPNTSADDKPCRPDFSVMNYPWEIVSQNLSVVAPELIDGVGPTQPPVFFSQAMDDPVAPCENSLVFMTQMKIKNAPLSELHLWPRGGHGYGLCTSNIDVCTWPQRAELWFRSNGWME
eukprot:TRINITY_DN11108_c0_g1_i1.p1 TRINITY_DN11108_c0_g1~~TRINITY_DN11108_c0_g1_i1.p1  ORF type:complete len:306 (+),score=32.77 TRINITY_DN11108_c0_g1_i1:62-919(+)